MNTTSSSTSSSYIIVAVPVPAGYELTDVTIDVINEGGVQDFAILLPPPCTPTPPPPPPRSPSPPPLELEPPTTILYKRFYTDLLSEVDMLDIEKYGCPGFFSKYWKKAWKRHQNEFKQEEFLKRELEKLEPENKKTKLIKIKFISISFQIKFIIK